MSSTARQEAKGGSRVILLGTLFAFCLVPSAFAGSWSQPSWVPKDPPPLASSNSRKKDLVGQEPAVNISPFAPGSNNLALDLGQVFLMGDLGSNYENSIGSQLHYTYGVSDIFGFDSSIGYSDHSNGKFSMLSVLTGLRTNLSWYDRVIPYITLGLGFYKPSYQLTPTSSLSPILFGIHLGPGVDLELSKQLFFGASITFHDIFGATKITPQGNLFDVGGTYTAFFVHIGVTF
jgi:hypothetical protein